MRAPITHPHMCKCRQKVCCRPPECRCPEKYAGHEQIAPCTCDWTEQFAQASLNAQEAFKEHKEQVKAEQKRKREEEKGMP